MLQYSWFFGDTPFECLVFYVATSPLWTNLCRGRIVGRFSLFEEAPIEGGDYELTGGTVTWGFHGITAWLIQANTNVEQRCIYYFLVLILKTICSIFLTCICIIKGTMVVFDFAMIRRCLRKVFKSARDILKRKWFTYYFSNKSFICCFIYWYCFHTWFSTSCCSKLVGYAFYFVHSLSTWFTHSLISPIFRFGIALAFLWRGGEFVASLNRLFSI